MVPTTHRWHSLTLADHYDRNRILADRLHDGRTVFPLLTHVFITCYDKWYHPNFLHPDYVPALKHLEAPITHFTLMHPPFSPALEEITITKFSYWDKCRFLYFLSFQGLKALSFCGYTGEGRIHPDTVALPLLTHLSLDVSHAEELLHILSVPSLTHVNYLQQSFETLFTAFNGIPSKWANVRELRLELPPRMACYREDYHVGLTALCLAAPEVQSVEVMAENLDELLDCREGLCPINHWVHLKKFTVIQGKVHQLNEVGSLYIVPWLKQQGDMAKLGLKVDFSLVNGDKAELNGIMLGEIGQYCDGVNLHMEERGL